MDKEAKKKNVWLELLRFAVTGLTAALFDYLICQLVIMAFGGVSIADGWVTAISTAAGFIIGVTINYFMSTYWVYQNVENKEKTKTPMFIFWFVVLSIGALLLSIGAMLCCDLVVQAVWDYSIVDVSIMELIKNNGINFLSQGIFWAYFVSFCVKTLVGLVFNYFTRKYILYRAPKEN